MNPLTPHQVSELLLAQPPPATVYLVGAGGCGMSGLGHLLLDLGYRVAGSDLVENEEIRQLRARGALIHGGHEGENLRAAQPVLVVYSSAIRRDNPELLAAQQQSLPMVRRAILLAALVSRQRSLCVAGMHGKTTTTAMLAFAFEQLGWQPSYAVGALVPQLPQHARLASPGKPGLVCTTPQGTKSAGAPWFVAEVDESDGTLPEFHPDQAILLNIDEEHLDYFANWETLCAEFKRFAAQTTGTVFYCADDSRLASLLAQHAAGVSFGFNSRADYQVVLLPGTGGTAPWVTDRTTGVGFEIRHQGASLGQFHLPLMGEKNASNAAAVIAALHQLGVEGDRIAAALRNFKGAARRQQEVFRSPHYRVYDDYGHHPSEITVTLSAMKALAGKGRLLVAFQPHRFTRTQHLLPRLATCFQGADRLWITEIYAASEPAIAGVDGTTLTAAVRASGLAAEFVPRLDSLAESVRSVMQPGDLVLFLGAGDITRVAQQLARQLQEEQPLQVEATLQELVGKLTPATLVRRDEPMAKRTTMRVGGRVDWYIEPAAEADLAEIMRFCGQRQLPFRLLGRGSNLLVRDGGIRGLVIRLAHPFFTRLEVQGDRIHCGAGALLREVVREARRQGLGGLEFLEGIPGSLGGALRMNAGAMGSSLFSVVESLRVMDFSGRIRELPSAEVKAEYRGCPFFTKAIALAAIIRGTPAPVEVIDRRLDTLSQRRWKTQPAAASAGCVFKNPAAIPAGKLIDELGLKGTRVGGAMVSEVHGNFIVNTGQATARDVLQLIDLVKHKARCERGIELETEVEIWGEND